MAPSEARRRPTPGSALQGLLVAPGSRLSRHFDAALVGALALLSVAVLLAGEVLLAGGIGMPLDDAWIHFQFARNLAEGRGMAFNPGVPSTGCTAPLWALLLAGALRFYPHPVAVAIALGTALFVATCFLTARIAGALTRSRRAALVAGCLAAVCPPLAWSAVSGMEAALYPPLVLAGVALYLRVPPGAGCRREIPSLVLLAAATTARPECALVPLFLLAERLRHRDRGRRFWDALGCLGIFGLLLTPYLTHAWMVGGSPLPNTLAAKVHQLWTPRTAVRFLTTRPLFALADGARQLLLYSPAQVLLVPAGLLALWRVRARGAVVLTLILLASPALRQTLIPFGGFGFQFERYHTHLFAVAAALAGVGVWYLLGERGGARRPAAPLVWAAALVCSVGGAWGPMVLTSRENAWAVKDIQTLHVQVGHWLRQHTPPGAVVAASDIGAIGYLSRRRILDTVGLVSPEVIPYVRVPLTEAHPVQETYNEAGLHRFLRRARPEFLVTFPGWYPRLVRDRCLSPVHRVWLCDMVLGRPQEMVVYRCQWSQACSFGGEFSRE